MVMWWVLLIHKVHTVYIDYVPQCIVHSSELGLSHPLSRHSPASVRLPQEPKGGGGTLACGWGVGGVPIPTTGEKLSTLPTLCPHTSGNSGARIKSGGRDGGEGHQQAAAVQGRSSFTPGWASHHHPSSRIKKIVVTISFKMLTTL